MNIKLIKKLHLNNLSPNNKAKLVWTEHTQTLCNVVWSNSWLFWHWTAKWVVSAAAGGGFQLPRVHTNTSIMMVAEYSFLYQTCGSSLITNRDLSISYLMDKLTVKSCCEEFRHSLSFKNIDLAWVFNKLDFFGIGGVVSSLVSS